MIMKKFILITLPILLTSCAQLQSSVQDLPDRSILKKIVNLSTQNTNQTTNVGGEYGNEVSFEEEWLGGSGYIARTEKAFNINGRTINLKYAWSGGNNCYVGFYFQEESNFTDIFHNSCYDITTIKTKQEGEKIFVTFQEKGKRKVKYQYNSSNGWVIEIK